MNENLLREITPLTQSDCFTLFSRSKKSFDFPLHYHEEFELNFIQQANGARRLIGDHTEEITDLELVLIGPNLQHAWYTHQCSSPEIKEITIQFHKDLFDEKFLRRNQLGFIRTMLQNSVRGILFSPETIGQIAPRILHLNQKNGFYSVIELMSILHDLSISQNSRMLSSSPYNQNKPTNSHRVQQVFEYLNQHFDKQITLLEVSKLAGMTEESFSRFFKCRSGKTFIDSLNDIRMGHASRMLVDTAQSIAEIAITCGFNNISNFNRIFKKKKKCTPKEFREGYKEDFRIFI